MRLENIKADLFNKGKEYGFSDMELYEQDSRSLELRVFKNEIDHYGLEETRGISFRGIYDGKLGYAYTEKLDSNKIEELLKNARDNARVIDKKEGEIFSGSEDYKQIDTFSKELDEVDPEAKIDFIKSLEEEAFAMDDRVVAVNYCMYSDLSSEKRIINSRGLDLKTDNNLAYVYCSVIAKEDDETRSGTNFVVTQDFSSLTPAKIAEKAVNEATSLFGAETLPSKNYPVILRHDVAADILATFSSTLSAENVQKGLSLFASKLGEEVAAPEVKLIDDPFLSGGARTAPFDDEGFATRKKEVIKDGKLVTYLHNLKTAKKDGVQSTGNAYRGSYKGFIDIAPSNMYIKPGNKSYQDLINEMDEGIIIIDVQGLHSGANPVSGDFSLGAYGYFVQKGEIVRPVEQITIAGNFLDLLKNIVTIGDDLKMGLPRKGHFGSPSLLIEELAVAGD